MSEKFYHPPSKYRTDWDDSYVDTSSYAFLYDEDISDAEAPGSTYDSMNASLQGIAKEVWKSVLPITEQMREAGLSFDLDAAEATCKDLLQRSTDESNS